jgi:putative transposase
MNTYKRHRFPPDIISYAVWLYYRFNLSHRDIEDLLAERGITVSREAIRLWCIKFGAIYTRRLKRKHRGFGDTLYIDEVFAGVPDHSNQWSAALSVASSRPGWRSR